MLRVNVTNHALDRWRKRVAVYGDAPESEVVAAVRAAVPVAPDDPTPFPQRAGSRYFRCEQPAGVYFVTEPLDRDYVNLITVLDCRPRALPQPTAAQEVIHRAVQQRKGTAEKLFERYPVPDIATPDPSAPVNERRDFWLGVQTEASFVLSCLINAHPDRIAWANRASAATCALTRLREEYREWKRERHHRLMDEVQTEVYGADGRINYYPALKFLLAEVDRLSAEVARLKSDRAEGDAAEVGFVRGVFING